MADNQYKIDLGIGLNQSQLNQTKQILESIENQKRDVIYNVDFNIKNVSKLTEVGKEIEKIQAQLKGKSQNAIPIDTKNVEASLNKIQDSVKKLRDAFGKVDSKKGVQSLLTTVNKINTALEKVSKQFGDLNRNLSSLSGKDFSLNFDFGFGKSSKNPEQAIKELNMLKKEVQEYEKYFDKLYGKKAGLGEVNTDPIGRLVGKYNPSQRLYKYQLQQAMSDSRPERQIAAHKEYLKLIKETAAIGNIALEPVEFKLAESSEFIKVRNEASETQKQLQELFSGGIDAESLNRNLSSITEDLMSIRKVLTELSAESPLGALKDSFDALSASIEKLLSNANQVKVALGDGLDNTASVDTGLINKIEKVSDDATNTVIQNEKKKQEAYKATADAVVYHAGVVSKLNKAETNGRFYGSERGTGYFGTGHYFVDSATKQELDNSSYSKLPYTSVDISKYDNLFRASTDEVAGRLHDFLKNLTLFTQGSDRYDISELFDQFRKVFGDTIMDVKEFGSRLDQLKAFMSSSSLDDRSDSVSTQFMKSLGYEGVDTRGTRYADTRYGTVIYDLKEESILQANITDELQKQGQMLEKINYAKGQVFDKSEDDRIQGILDAQNKRREIENEFKNSFDTTNLDKAESDLSAAENRIREIDGIISDLQRSIDNADQEARKFAKDMEDIGLGYTDEEVDDYKKRFTESYRNSIDELSQEKAELQSKIPVLEEVYNRENQLANEAYEQAKQTVEQRHLEAQQAQETANTVVRSEERKQQAYQETADEAKKAANASLSKEVEKINKKLSDSDLGFSKYDNEIDSVTTKFNKLENQSEQLQSDMRLLNSAFADIKAASAANDTEALVSANREYEQILTRVKNQLDINSRAEKEAAAVAKKEASEIAKAQKEAAAIARKQQKEADSAAVKELNTELKKLESLARQIGQLDFKIVKSDYKDEVSQVKEFERQLELLKTQYNETLNSLNGKDIDIGSEITKEFTKARNKIAEFEAKVSDTKAELAKKIKLGLDDGDFNVISEITRDANKLTGTYPKLTATIQEVKNALNEMEVAAGTGEEVADVEKLISAHERFEHALKNVNNQLKENRNKENYDFDKESLDLKKQAASLDIDYYLKNNTRAARELGDEFRDLQRRIDACDDSKAFTNLQAELRTLKSQANTTLDGRTQSFGDKLKKQWQQYTSYLSIASLFQYAEQGLRSMFEQVKLIDSAMTELKKVTNETDAAYDQFLTNAATRSREIGTTIDGLVSSTADFARLGYGFEDAQGLAEVANIYAVVGDEIEGVEGATESLISTMAAFKDSASDMSNTDFAMSIIDKFNEIGNNFSISSGGIGEALERSASSLMAANNTLDESIALITAANTVVQDPEAVGKVMPTLKVAISVKPLRRTRPRKDFISIFGIHQLGRVYVFLINIKEVILYQQKVN